MSQTQRLTAAIVAVVGLLAIFALPAVATAKDRNHDRIPDRWEKRHHLSLNVNQAHRDQDRDRLANRAEFLAGDDPRDVDSDNDGIDDGEENAGKIQSFDAATGRLVINLFNGDSVAGMVTDQTEIKCENENEGEHAAGATASDDGEESSDGNGGSEEEPGDDQSENSGPGSASSGPGDDNHEASNCTTADLVPGAVVEEAELEVAGGSATFEEVELAG